MLCAKGSDKDLQRVGWLAEIKMDGTRAFLIKTDKTFRIQSRPRKYKGAWTCSDYTRRLPEITREAKNIDDNYILDGELCFFNGKGISEFTPSQRRCSTQNLRKILRLMRQYPLIFSAFELLQAHGEDYTKTPFLERKANLEEWLDLQGLENIRFVEHREDPERLFDEVLSRGGEGVVLKRYNSIYRYDIRSPDWLKVRPWQKGVFHVVGYTHSDKRLFKGLVLEENGEWIGNTGGGIKNHELKQLWRIFTSSPRIRKPFETDEPYTAIGTNLTVQVKYFRKTENGKLRFPSFLEIVNSAQTSLFWGGFYSKTYLSVTHFLIHSFGFTTFLVTSATR